MIFFSFFALNWFKGLTMDCNCWLVQQLSCEIDLSEKHFYVIFILCFQVLLCLCSVSVLEILPSPSVSCCCEITKCFFHPTSGIVNCLNSAWTMRTLNMRMMRTPIRVSSAWICVKPVDVLIIFCIGFLLSNQTSLLLLTAQAPPCRIRMRSQYPLRPDSTIRFSAALTPWPS